MRPAATHVEEAAMLDALQAAATRCGRLSDEQVRALRRRRRAALAAAGSVGAAALALVIGIPDLTKGPAPATPRVLATRPGEQGRATLADGSVVRLNGASRVEVAYSGTGRAARLVAGQAFFDVRHDASRPFTVRVGDGAVRVLGTAFDLDRTRGQVALMVYRGAVALDAGKSGARVVVRAGYRSRLHGQAVEAPVRFDAGLPDWRQGWVDTAGMRLDALVEVLNRQAGPRIAIPAPQFAAVTVAGRFRTDRPRQLLGTMGEAFGFQVVERPDGLHLEPDR